MAKDSYNIRKTQERTDLFNTFSDEFNKGKKETEYREARLFDESLKLAIKFLRYRKRKLQRLRKQEEELIL